MKLLATLATFAAFAMSAAPAAAQSTPPASASGPVGSGYVVPDTQTRLALRDLDGDGRRDLLIVGPSGLSWRRLREDGSFPAADDGALAWPSPTVGWNVADLHADGKTEVVLLIDGTRVATVGPGELGALVLAPDLLSDVGGFLPRGIRRINFVRDVDGDGRLDLVIPGNGKFLIRLQQESGWAAALPVGYQPSVDIELGDPSRLDARFAQDVQIPWFTLQDIDGDGRIDLVSETEQVVQFHLARPGLPEKPTWTLDLAALKAQVPKPERFDLDNLLSNVEAQVNWRVADLDGEPPNDLVVQVGGKISLYLGGSVGPQLEAPDQVLKASGNVLYFLLRDVNKDGKPDLQLLRGATISLGEVLRLLVVPGSMDFDVFSYNNEGGQFARKPSVRTTLSLRIPALLGFLDDIKDMQKEYWARRAVPAQPAALDGDGALNDIVDVVAGSDTAAAGGASAGDAEGAGDASAPAAAATPGAIGVWKGAVPDGFKPGGLSEMKKFGPDELLEQYALSKLDALSDGGTLSIEVKDIQKLMVTPGYDLRQAAAARAPDERWPLPFPAEGATLRIEDIDGDGKDDVIVMGQDAQHRQQVQFFVSR